MSVLFHQNLVVAVLGSGSRGNCTYIGDGVHGVLVDCGISTRQVLARLDQIGLGEAPVDAVLVTHEHADHVGAAAILDRRLEQRSGKLVPFIMTAGTRQCLHPKVVPRRVVATTPGSPFRIGKLLVDPFAIPHDTLDPVAYTVQAGPTRVAVVTDLGSTPRLVAHQLSTADIAVLEFNHDVQMLMEGAYPWALKQRIRGGHGHLSNLQAAELLVRAAPPRLRHLVLAHLSEENNRPEKALEAADGAIGAAKLRGVTVHVAAPDLPYRIDLRKPILDTGGPPRTAREVQRDRPASGSRRRISRRCLAGGNHRSLARFRLSTEADRAPGPVGSHALADGARKSRTNRRNPAPQDGGEPRQQPGVVAAEARTKLQGRNHHDGGHEVKQAPAPRALGLAAESL